MSQDVKVKFSADTDEFVRGVGQARDAFDALAETEREFQRQIAEGRGYDELQVRLRGLTDTLIEFGGTPEQAAKTLSNLREAAKTTGLPLATLAKIAEKYADEAEQGIVTTQEMARVMRFAAASGERYEDAARMMGMAVKGSTDALRKLGPEAKQAADAIDRIINPAERAAAVQSELNRAMLRVERSADKLTGGINKLNTKLSSFMGPGTDVVSMLGGAGGATGMAAAFTVTAGAATALGAAVLKTANESLDAFIKKSTEAKRIADELAKSEKQLEENTGGLLYTMTEMDEVSRNNAARLDGVSGALANAEAAVKRTDFSMTKFATGVGLLIPATSGLVQNLGNATAGYDALNKTQQKAADKQKAYANAQAWEQLKTRWATLGEQGSNVLGALADGWDHLGEQADAYLKKIEELQKANPVYGPRGPDGSMVENWGERQTLYANQLQWEKEQEEKKQKARRASAAKHRDKLKRDQAKAFAAAHRARLKANERAEKAQAKHYAKMKRMAEQAARDRIKAMEARARDVADARRRFIDDRSGYYESVTGNDAIGRAYAGDYHATRRLGATDAAEVRRRQEAARKERMFGLDVDPWSQQYMDDPVYSKNDAGELRRQRDEYEALRTEMELVASYGPIVGASIGQAFGDIATGAKTAGEAIAGSVGGALDQVVPMFTAYGQALVAAGSMNPWALFAATMALSALTSTAKNMLSSGSATGGRTVSPVQRTDSLQNQIRREREREDVEINVTVQMGTERLSEAMVRTTAQANRFGQLRGNRPRG